MAEIGEAFNILKTQKKQFQNIDYFFVQRNLTEEQEFLDKNMNRKNKKIKVLHNFLALNIPTIMTILTSIGQSIEKPVGFDIEIYGDEGYHYKGTITSCQGTIPNFMIPLKGDKKLFVNINYNFTDSTKKFINFIEVPKRFQANEDTIDSKRFQSDESEDTIETL